MTRKIKLKNSLILFLFLFIIFITSGCAKNNDKQSYDGRLDVEIIRLTSPMPGFIQKISIDQGSSVSKNNIIAKIKTDKLRLQKKQNKIQQKELNLQLKSIALKQAQVKSDLALNKSLLQKTKRMVLNDAATPFEYDKLLSKVAILSLKKQDIESQKKLVRLKKAQLKAGLDILNVQFRDSKIKSPINGIVLNKYVNQGEYILPGMAIAELADLKHLRAYIYIPLKKLSNIKIGQKAWLGIDGLPEKIPGKITWIADQAEFTPKTILTQETRTTLVYAVKIEVENPDNLLKIGMPCDIYLD
ncbi:HlyD family secretion protein [Candidatus Margulisiibacteriota bacterium]